MQLKLNMNGSVEPFENYLESFVRIRPSIILEIDTTSRQFVCKLSTEDKSCVKMSSISFDACNFSIVSHDGESTIGNDRIKCGILLALPKFISMLKKFGSDVDKEGRCHFDMVVNYDTFSGSNNSVDYVTTSIVLQSSTLKMKLDGFRLSEMKFVTDSIFQNVIFAAQDPVTFELDSNTISSIMNISDIIKTDAAKDALTFFVEGNSVYVKDLVNDDKQPNFVYKIAELESESPVDGDVSATVYREKFLTMLKKTNEKYRVMLGYKINERGERHIDRILFDSLESVNKIAISVMTKLK